MIEVLTTSFNQKTKVAYDKMYLPTSNKFTTYYTLTNIILIIPYITIY